VSTSKAIQIILARQLASCVAMPILLVDADGTLVFYNEPAEAILGQRFEETGEIPADEWNRLVAIADDDRKPIPPDDRPTWVARLQLRPVSRTIWMRSADSRWRHLQVTAFPLVGEAGHMLGVMSIFWEI
jgi:PAS domain-containing protein